MLPYHTEQCFVGTAMLVIGYCLVVSCVLYEWAVFWWEGAQKRALTGNAMKHSHPPISRTFIAPGAEVLLGAVDLPAAPGTWAFVDHHVLLVEVAVVEVQVGAHQAEQGLVLALPLLQVALLIAGVQQHLHPVFEALGTQAELLRDAEQPWTRGPAKQLSIVGRVAGLGLDGVGVEGHHALVVVHVVNQEGAAICGPHRGARVRWDTIPRYFPEMHFRSNSPGIDLDMTEGTSQDTKEITWHPGWCSIPYTCGLGKSILANLHAKNKHDTQWIMGLFSLWWMSNMQPLDPFDIWGGQEQ